MKVFSKRARPLVGLLLVTLVLVLAAGQALAAPSGGIPPGQAKKALGRVNGGLTVFTDVENGHWAWGHIHRMGAKGILAGYGDGKFGPGNNVSRLELVIMTTRLMGYEDEALAMDAREVDTLLNAAFRDVKSIPTWPGARECLAYALKHDYVWPLMQGASTQNFQANAPAKRVEVVVVLLEAMGLRERAEVMRLTPLNYRDATSVPTWAWGHIALAVHLGILQGDDANTLRPNQPVNRAEMAALLERAGFETDPGLDQGVVRGTVTRVTPATGTATASTISIIPAGQGSTATERTYTLDARVVVMVNRTVTTLADVHPGDQAALYLNAEGLVILVDVEYPTSEVTGVVVSFTAPITTATGSLTLHKEAQDTIYTVAIDVAVTRAGLTVPISQIRTGDTVKVRLDRSTVVAIEIIDTQGIVSGAVTRVTVPAPTAASGDSTISIIPDYTGTTAPPEQTYTLAAGAVVLLNGARAVLTDIKAGDHATLHLGQGGKVILVDATYEITELTGVLAALTVNTAGDLTSVTIGQDGLDTTLAVAPGAEVVMGGRRVPVSQLQAGDRVKARIARGAVFSLEILEYAVTEVSGTVSGIIRDAEGDLITIVLLNDAVSTTYEVDADVQVTLAGEPVDPGALLIGDAVTLSVVRGIVTGIAIAARTG